MSSKKVEVLPNVIKVHVCWKAKGSDIFKFSKYNINTHQHTTATTVITFFHSIKYHGQLNAKTPDGTYTEMTEDGAHLVDNEYYFQLDEKTCNKFEHKETLAEKNRIHKLKVKHANMEWKEVLRKLEMSDTPDIKRKIPDAKKEVNFSSCTKTDCDKKVLTKRKIEEVVDSCDTAAGNTLETTDGSECDQTVTVVTAITSVNDSNERSKHNDHDESIDVNSSVNKKKKTDKHVTDNVRLIDSVTELTHTHSEMETVEKTAKKNKVKRTLSLPKSKSQQNDDTTVIDAQQPSEDHTVEHSAEVHVDNIDNRHFKVSNQCSGSSKKIKIVSALLITPNISRDALLHRDNTESVDCKEENQDHQQTVTAAQMYTVSNSQDY